MIFQVNGIKVLIESNDFELSEPNLVFVEKRLSSMTSHVASMGINEIKLSIGYHDLLHDIAVSAMVSGAPVHVSASTPGFHSSVRDALDRFERKARKSRKTKH